jgi:hypothetical protein
VQFVALPAHLVADAGQPVILIGPCHTIEDEPGFPERQSDSPRYPAGIPPLRADLDSIPRRS